MGGRTPGQSAVAVQVHTRAWAAQSALPKFARLVETDSDIIEAARHFAQFFGGDLANDADLVMNVFFPASRADIARYYRARGPKLIEIFSRQDVALLDNALCDKVPETVRSWQAARANCESRGQSTKVAAREFAASVLGYDAPSPPDLRLHQQEPPTYPG